VVAYHWLR